MTKPTMSAAMRKGRLAEVSATRDSSMSTNSESVKDIVRDIDGALPTASPSAVKPATLPKVTLYAHASVLKALRLVAVEEGVQTQEILRKAVRDYLATKGHHFKDMTTGQ